jgi:hypothetical protein
MFCSLVLHLLPWFRILCSTVCSHISSIYILSSGTIDQVLHPCWRVVKVKILYILIFEPTTLLVTMYYLAFQNKHAFLVFELMRSKPHAYIRYHLANNSGSWLWWHSGVALFVPWITCQNVSTYWLPGNKVAAYLHIGSNCLAMRYSIECLL